MKKTNEKKTALRIKAVVSVLLSVGIFFTSTQVVGAVDPDAELLDNDEFGMAVSQCIIEENGTSSCDEQRVIGKTDGTVDFSKYDADEVIMAEDGRFMLKFDSVSEAEKCINNLSKNDDVLYAESDGTIKLCAEYETKATKSLSWGSGAIQTDELTECLKDVDFDRTVTVAVVDSGAAKIDYLKKYLIEGYDYVDNDSDPSNDTSSCSHGTFISSIVVDNVRKLPVNIMPVRVVSKETSTVSNVANGVYYAADHGADVINLSLGGGAVGCKAIDNSIEYAVSKNIAVVVSAGNECDNTMYYCPAHIASAITVSAVDSDMNFAKDYSNFGAEVDFAAPGTNIVGYNAKGKKISLDGTSMSAGFISSCMAILKLLYPAESVETLQTVLADSAVNPQSLGRNNYYGYGVPQMMFFSGYTDGGIFLVPLKNVLVPGETYKFRAYNLSDLSTVKKTEWTSSNKDVAEVDINGAVKALKAGKAEITCKSLLNNATSKCTVKVKSILNISVVSLPYQTVYEYKTEQFDPSGIEIKVKYSDGTTEIVSDCSRLSFEGFNPYQAGTQKITVKYYDAQTDFEVGVGYSWWQMLIRIFLFGWIWY